MFSMHVFIFRSFHRILLNDLRSMKVCLPNVCVPLKRGAWTQTESLEYGRWRLLAPALPSVFTDALALAVHRELRLLGEVLPTKQSTSP